MKNSIFEYRSYKRYLRDLIACQPKKGRGFRTALAKAAGCQMTFVSQVLGGDRHFSFEQMDGISAFLGQGEDEARFFLLLLSYERAGTENLRKRYQKEIEKEHDRYLTFASRFKDRNVLTPEAQSTFYSAWYYLAIQVALTIPQLRTKDALVKALDLPMGTVSQVLDFLVQTGLANPTGVGYQPTKIVTFVKNDSPLVRQHHMNWRLKALASLDPNNREDLHYSALVSFSKEDFATLKALFMKAIEESYQVWSTAKKEEELCGITVDFFKIWRTD